MLNSLLPVAAVLGTGIFGGYTLNPVPKRFNYLADNSQVFRTLILILTGLILYLHELSVGTFVSIVLVSIGIQWLFEQMRKWETETEQGRNVILSQGNTK